MRSMRARSSSVKYRNRGWSECITNSLFIAFSLPPELPFAVLVAAAEAPGLLHTDVLDSGQLRHPLEPSGDSVAPRDLGGEVDERNAGARRRLVLDAQLPAVVERAPHLRSLR